MNIKGFFVDALTSALELGIGTPDDVVRHVTPEILAKHLPRPLWARLLTACLGAPVVDATLVVETIGVPNFCEHVPASIIWACLAEIGARSLGKTPDIASAPAPLTRADLASKSARSSVLAPPPEAIAAPPAPVNATPVAIGPSIPAPAPTAAADQPLADLITELEQDGAGDSRLGGVRPRSPTAQRFRQSSTGIQRLGSARRPQAAATPAPGTSTGARPRRDPTEAELDMETHVGPDKEPREIGVDDSQLVDWQATDGSGAPAVTDEDFSDLGRKR